MNGTWAVGSSEGERLKEKGESKEGRDCKTPGQLTARLGNDKR
jgi:hypothetical protein